MQVRAYAGGELVEERATRFGLRKLELVREREAGGESFLFRLNHVPVFCKGADWIPADSFIPRLTTAHYRTLLTMARAAHMNMLRIWGGGIYEQEIFYDLCDELGLLVWQDFMFACGGYPDYPEFVDNVRREVLTVVKQLRNHPGLALWCGNNENEWLYNLETRRPYRELPGISLFAETIPEICATHDPTRPYWQSSPFGGEDPNSEQQGDRHQWQVWSNWADPKIVAKDRGRFLSEFGLQALATLATWKKFLSPSDWWPQSPVFEFHNKQVEGPERLFRFLAAQVKMPVDFEDFIFKTQIVQAEALKTMIEHWRREKFHTAGTLFWQLNDCWPVSSWSVIDSELRPKAAYWYCRRFFAPVLLSFRMAGPALEVWGTNDTLSTCAAEFEVEILELGGKVEWVRREQAGLPANSSQRLAELVCEDYCTLDPHRPYVRVRLRTAAGMIVAENRHFFCPYKHLRLEAPQLDWRLQALEACAWQVQIKTDRLAKSLALLELPENVAVSENYFDLDGGCEKSITISRPAAAASLETGELVWKWLS